MREKKEKNERWQRKAEKARRESDVWEIVLQLNKCLLISYTANALRYKIVLCVCVRRT